MIYPWQAQSFQHLKNLQDSNRLPHALLISGENSGELNFAQHFAQFLLCQNKNASPCGECQSCRWFVNQAHPDYFLLAPEEESTIKIDEIRELTSWLETTAQFQYKIAVISLAENMTIAAANSLLKKLEEPVGNKIIILVTQRSKDLLATIRSRCQEIRLTLPAAEEAKNWLSQQQVDIHELSDFFYGNPVTMINLIGDENCRSYLLELDQFFEDRIDSGSLNKNSQSLPLIKLFDLTWSYLQKKAPTLSLELIDFIIECKRNLSHSIHLNEDLIKENFFIKLQQIQLRYCENCV